MAKTKTKRNAGRSRARHGFKVCENPTVHLAGDGLLPDVNRIGVTHAHGQPFLFATWHSVATSGEVEMPPQGSVELADVDLATIPFHLSFQQLANLFGTANDTSVARLVSEFQKRVLSSDKPNEAAPSDTRILRGLNLSLPEIATAEHNFKKIDTEKLMRRARAMVSIRRDQSSAWIRSESSWS